LKTVMAVSRAIPLSAHAAIETIAAPAIMAAPLLLGFTQAAALVAFVIGALLLGLALQAAGPRRTIPLSAHAGLDYTLAAAAVVAGLVIGIDTGAWAQGVFLVGVGVAQVALTASTRFSVPVGA
jgi:predicted MFS family arabinose efflux permease